MPLLIAGQDPRYWTARQSDFEEMERCLFGGEHNRDYELFEQWDAAFHRSLAVATQNQLLVAIMGEPPRHVRRLSGHAGAVHFDQIGLTKRVIS